MTETLGSSPAVPNRGPATAKSPPRFRWWPAPFVIGLGLVAQQAAWWILEPDRTLQVFSTAGAGAFIGAGLLLWWFFGSRLKWRTRLIGAGSVAAIATLFWCSAVRLDGFSGEMIPRFSWRWQRTPEDRAEDFRKSPPLKSEPLSALTSQEEPLVVTDDDWPEYRGRRRDGVVWDAAIRTDWRQFPPRLVWKHPVGLGWSSFAVVDGLAFTQEQRREDETVVCYDAKTGNEIWAHGDPVRFVHSMAGDGPRATPTVRDGRVYTLGATGILNCFAARSGRKLWSHDTLAEANAVNPEWGTSASPLVYDNVVVVNPGGPDGRAVVAYDRVSGKQVWSSGSDPASYASPQLNQMDDVRQVLIFDAVGLAGHAAETGEQLWKFPWSNSPKVNAAQPILLGQSAEGLVFIGNGYTVGSALLNVAHQDGIWSVGAPVWKTKQLKLKFNCAVARDGYIYGLDEGILSCVNAADGKRAWKGGRYGYGQLMLVGDRLLIQADSGELALVDADAAGFREACRFPALQGKTWNHPAMGRNHRLFVRNGEEAACYDLSIPEE